jgi:hypothetical protein
MHHGVTQGRQGELPSDCERPDWVSQRSRMEKGGHISHLRLF